MPTKIFLLLFIITGCATQKKAIDSNAGLEAHLRGHVSFLSNDKLEGRRTGTAGEAEAAAYISDAFKKMGLLPKGTDGFYQSFPVSEGRDIASTSYLKINDEALVLKADFFPLHYSSNGDINAQPSIALMEKGEPWFFDLAETITQNKNNPHFDLAAAVFNQATEVAKKGATALFVYNSASAPDALVFDAKYKAERLNIPVIYLNKGAAKKYLHDPSAMLRLQARIDIQEKNRSGKNVVGYVDNGAPYTVIIGAHYDHLGYGEDQNSRHTGTDKQIHNGADDNASGTAAMIELARMISAYQVKGSNYLFIAFSGEELGLFGSKYFTQHPTIDLGNVNYMVNLDMVGRMPDSAKTLTVGGFGTSPTWSQLYNRQGKESLFAAATYRFDSSGTGPSDHTSFYQKNIPVLFYFTGLHTDYHKPTDDFDKINYTGQALIVKHIYSLLQATEKLNTKLAFTKTREAQTTTTARFSVTMGIMPDYTYTGNGVRADGVTDGRPAQKAGIQAGDIITAIGDYKISSMESYMQTLGKFKKGESATVQFLRNGQALKANVLF